MRIETNTDYGITAGAGLNIGILGITLLFTEGLTEIFAGRKRTGRPQPHHLARRILSHPAAR